jgi:hypothetical protein
MNKHAPVPGICGECMDTFARSIVETTGDIVSFMYCEHRSSLLRVSARNGAITHYVLDGPCSREEAQTALDHDETALRAKGLLVYDHKH